MRGFFGTALVMLMLSIFFIGTQSYIAFGYPGTVYTDKTFQVTGRVLHSDGGMEGIPGVYVAIINASSWQEYDHTTTDSNGDYNFNGVVATYSSVHGTGPDGNSGSYMHGQLMYQIMAKKGSVGPQYSAMFGIDYNGAVMTSTCVILDIPHGTPMPTATPSPGATNTPTATPHASITAGSPTPTSTPGPAPTRATSPSPASATPAPAASGTVTPQPGQASALPETPTPTPGSPGVWWLPVVIAIGVVGIIALVAVVFIVMRFR